jgi:hypothetical protein
VQIAKSALLAMVLEKQEEFSRYALLEVGGDADVGRRTCDGKPPAPQTRFALMLGGCMDVYMYACMSCGYICRIKCHECMYACVYVCTQPWHELLFALMLGDVCMCTCVRACVRACIPPYED